MKTLTPKTDAIYKEYSTCFPSQELTFVYFARQLEVQVQELREALALLIVATDHKCGVAEQANHARAVLERTK